MNAERSTPILSWLKPMGRRLVGTLVQVETSERVVALTFDDGPHPVYTPQILDLLAEFEARATFFMIGRHAAEHRDLVARVAAEGHAIGNHTFSHVPMSATSRWRRWRELRAARRAIAPYGARLFRPPFGGQTYGSRLDLLLFGYEVVCWNVQIDDWVAQSSAELADRLNDQVHPGFIVLLHDQLENPRDLNAVDRTPLIEALAAVLARRRPEYRFVTVPELMRIGRPVRRPWFRPAL